MNREIQDDLGIIGQSQAIKQIREIIRQVAPTNISVLITGESGTGKELVARALHRLSPRRNMPMITVNCGAIPEGILESELFGHQRGAFTGAVETRKGYFELADGGTLFLDEIGDMPLATQVKILRVLEEKEFMRVGGTTPKRVDVRIIAASNKNLQMAVQKGEFREDLYYRLNAVNIHVPPLRERREDIPLLIKKFTTDFCRENKIEFEGFTEGALRRLENYPWPGNVRELKNLVESIIVLEKGRRIDEFDLSKYLDRYQDLDRNLPVRLQKSSEQAERELIYRALVEIRADIAQIKEFLSRVAYLPQRVRALESQDVSDRREEVTVVEIPTMEEMEKELIRKTLEKFNGNRRKTAKALKISERTLYRKIKEYGLN